MSNQVTFDKNGKPIFAEGTERLGPNGHTQRYLQTAKSKREGGEPVYQWLTIDPETDEPVKRGRREGQKSLESKTLYQVLQVATGRKGAKAAKDALEAAGLGEVFSTARVTVSQKWFADPTTVVTSTVGSTSTATAAEPSGKSPASRESL